MLTMVEDHPRIIGGVDTHRDTHTVAAIDERGQELGHATFPTTAQGYAQLWAWLTALGHVVAVGVEGTSSYGAALTRHLLSAGGRVIEVNRPDRGTRRRVGKSAPIDALMAARGVLAGTAATAPKDTTGVIEAIAVLRSGRRSAIKSRTAAINSLRAHMITAPADLRAHLDDLPITQLIATCARLRPDHARIHDPAQAVKATLRRLARRYQALNEEIADIDADLAPLVARACPKLLKQSGIGIQTAAQLLVTAGGNPDRIRTDASFAALCGASPIPASSGRTDRHRLNRGGDRQGNHALHQIVINRIAHHQPTRDYIARRTANGLKKRDVIRCLKRYVARDVQRLITQALTESITLPTIPEQAAQNAA
ncbi:IS110 family transposase [Flexivirga alba]|uniref:IS110 family transposase n=1 Tax=Flexivirga alba TaxID=702742 RepID=A0ABW2AFS2_9MICO